MCLNILMEKNFLRKTYKKKEIISKIKILKIMKYTNKLLTIKMYYQQKLS